MGTEEKLELYSKKLNDLGHDEINEDLLRAVVKHLGPSIYNADAELVSTSDSDELDRVRQNFLQKKLALEHAEEELNEAIQEIAEVFGSQDRQKHRAVYYYLLAQKFDKDHSHF